MAKRPSTATIQKAWLKQQTGDILEYGKTLKPGGKPFNRLYNHINSGKDLLELSQAVEWINERDKIFAGRRLELYEKATADAEKERLDKVFSRDREPLSPSEVEEREFYKQIEKEEFEKKLVGGPEQVGERFDVREQRLLEQRQNQLDLNQRANITGTAIHADRRGPLAGGSGGKGTGGGSYQESMGGTKSKNKKNKNKNKPYNHNRAQEGFGTLEAYKRAIKHLGSRSAHPESFLTAEDQRILESAKEYIKKTKGLRTPTRWDDSNKTATPEYKKVDSFIGRFNKEVRRQGREMFPAGSKQYDDFVSANILNRGHFNPKGSALFGHQWDVDSNMTFEQEKSNINDSAKLTFGQYVEGMHRAASNKPFTRPEIPSRVFKVLNRMEDDGGLKNEFRKFKNRKNFIIPEDLEDFFNVQMLNGNGNFANLEQMRAANPNIDISPKDHESLRRLAITMWSQNSEADLPAFLKSSGKLSDDYFVRGTRESDNKIVSALGVAVGNEPGKKGGVDLSNREKIINLARAGAKVGIPLAGLLAYSGATYSADESWSEDDYVDHILANLEKYDNAIVEPGKDIIMNFADKVGLGEWMRSVDERVSNDLAQSQGPSGYVARFIYDMGKEIPAETVGLLNAVVQTPVAPPENLSWAERAAQKYGGIVRSDW